MTELVTVFILSKDEQVLIQANLWWTYGEKMVALDKVCSEYLASLSYLSTCDSICLPLPSKSAA